VTAPLGRPLAITVSWRTVVLILIAVAAWDAPALILGGDTAYRSTAYDITRSVPGGIRAWGVILGALLTVLVIGFYRFERGANPAMVRTALVGMTGWWSAWGTAIVSTWPYHRDGHVTWWSIVAGLLVLCTALLLVLGGRHARGWLLVGLGAWMTAWGAGLEVPSWSGASRPIALAVLALVAARAVAGRNPGVSPAGRG
jgi:hypothetical protein